MQQIDIGGVLSSMVFVYAQIFSNFSLNSIMAQIILIVIIKTIYIVVSSFLQIAGSVSAIFAACAYMHQIFHAHAAKKLNNKYTDEFGRSSNPVRISTSLGDSSIRSKEYSNLSFMINNSSTLTTRDIAYFANSSSVPAFVMLLVIVSVGPLMQQFFFAILHFYILCGIVLCLMPSKADSKLITNFILMRTEISGWYVVDTFLVFLLAAGTYGLKYQYLNYYPSFWFVEPILMGIWSVMCYMFFLSMVLLLTTEKKVSLEKNRYRNITNEADWTEEETKLFNELLGRSTLHTSPSRRYSKLNSSNADTLNDLTMMADLETD